ncbi:hypothetical protein [Sciscionella sediminilitoris]|uniref:hypothetical protein n=1 Tax=Sciscionella sediminilitoris TaxID=1445613 RepID=UPI0012E17687|nr:hypothetical protein [Sciscionella sp. SE31]
MAASSNHPGKMPHHSEALELEVVQSREALADTVAALRERGTATNLKHSTRRELRHRLHGIVSAAREQRAFVTAVVVVVLLAFFVKRKRHR